MASQSPMVVFGSMISEPGNYLFCWLTRSESGEITRNSRNVVISKHGHFFYFRWANESFTEYPCGHEGLRCDLVEPTESWFVRTEGRPLEDAEVIWPGDQWMFAGGAAKEIEASFHHMTVSRYRLRSGRDQCTVLRPTDNEHPTARIGGAVGLPGLQAAR